MNAPAQADDGLNDWVTRFIGDATVTVNAAFALILLVVVAVTYYKTRALIPVIMVGLTGALAIWIANNSSWLQEKISNETSAPAVRAVATLARARLGVG